MVLGGNGAMVEWQTAVKNAKGNRGIPASVFPSSIANLIASAPELKASLRCERPTRNHLSYRTAFCSCGLLVILCLPYFHSKLTRNWCFKYGSATAMWGISPWRHNTKHRKKSMYQSFFIHQLMHNWIVLKTILKFTLKLTLKQLLHVSV
jgi:hypothetical protein